MKKVDTNERNHMMEMAFEALTHAYAPYSKFFVGACLKSSDGKYYLGCNIENAAYTPTNCAERTALFQAVYDGAREFDALAIACSGDTIAYPCGVCRQALSEFCDPAMPIICANAQHETQTCTLAELLPHSFGPKDLL